jgi:uncharacterized protein YciW
MSAHQIMPLWWRSSRRLPVDDAYNDWFSAYSRCTLALAAWNAAAPSARRAAYSAYLAALEIEEAAARRLEQLQPQLAAA